MWLYIALLTILFKIVNNTSDIQREAIGFSFLTIYNRQTRFIMDIILPVYTLVYAFISRYVGEEEREKESKKRKKAQRKHCKIADISPDVRV